MTCGKRGLNLRKHVAFTLPDSTKKTCEKILDMYLFPIAVVSCKSAINGKLCQPPVYRTQHDPSVDYTMAMIAEVCTDVPTGKLGNVL